MNCETCAFYIYDEDYGEYVCSADMDEDDYASVVYGNRRQCPFWRNGDEYDLVRHQM